MANCLRVIREARALHSDWPADEVERTDKLKTTFEFSGQRSQYSNWASDIIGYLEGRGVVHHLFVSDAAAPPGNDADLKARRVANRAAVVAYLRMCIKGEAKDDISSFRQEPRKIWEALENVYGSGSEAELATLQTQYDSFVMANGETMEHLYRRLGKLIREMADLGQVVDDATKRRTLLNSIVDRSWEHTVMRIREDSGNLTALQVFTRLQGVEKQLIANEKKRELMLHLKMLVCSLLHLRETKVREKKRTRRNNRVQTWQVLHHHQAVLQVEHPARARRTRSASTVARLATSSRTAT